MKTLLIDQTGDLVFKNGDFVLIEGDEELAQSVKVLLQTSKGEWFLDESFGLDRNSIFSKNFNEEEAKNSIIEVLAQEERIASVEEITFSRIARELYVTLSLLKQDGTALLLQEVNI
jgi:hypothetical protein